MASFWRHSTRIPKMMATAPATNTGRVSRSMRYTQNIADMRAGQQQVDGHGRHDQRDARRVVHLAVVDRRLRLQRAGADGGQGRGRWPAPGSRRPSGVCWSAVLEQRASASSCRRRRPTPSRTAIWTVVRVVGEASIQRRCHSRLRMPRVRAGPGRWTPDGIASWPSPACAVARLARLSRRRVRGLIRTARARSPRSGDLAGR